MKALIIANGTHPESRLVKELAYGADLVVCADGGANIARKMRVNPDIILGDLDSITPATKTYYKSVPLLRIPDQNSTDLEKALRYCIDRQCRHVDIVGATGHRIDHTIGSLGCFKRFGGKISMRLIDPLGEMTMIRKRAIIQTRIKERISLIPLSRCIGVTTKNLKYALNNNVLELGVREGISNEATGTKVTILVRRGTLLLFRFFDHSADA